MKSTTKTSAFFHTLVVVGGSIVGCGGQAHDAGEESGDGDGAMSGGRAGIGSGDGDGDVASGSGGTIIGSGGSNGVGGGIILATGGATGAGGEYMGGAHGLGCPPEQWSCSNLPYDCNWQQDELLTNCTCDETKPVEQSDCPDGTSITCMNGIEYDSDFNGTMQPFACQCLPTEETCSDQCSSLGGYPSDCSEPGMNDFQGYLCGCELPVLR